MIRNIFIIIGLTLFLSACCEKEGSFLNTAIKNHAAKIAAATHQQAVIKQPPLLSNDNATTPITANTLPVNQDQENTISKTTQALTVEESITATTTQQEDVSKLEKIDITATSNDQLLIKNKIIQHEVITDIDQSQAAAETKLSPEDKPSDATRTAAVAIDQEPVLGQTEDIIEQIIDQPAALTDEQSNDDQSVIPIIEKTAKLTPASESTLDKNKRLLELLSKDLKQQAQKPNPEISPQSLELLNDILSD